MIDALHIVSGIVVAVFAAGFALGLLASCVLLFLQKFGEGIWRPNA